MNKILRKGGNIKIAFFPQSYSSIMDLPPIPMPLIVQPRIFSVRSLIKFAYRLAKPLIRPFDFRLRRYIIAGLGQEVLEEIYKASASEIEKKLQQNSGHTALRVRTGFKNPATDIIMMGAGGHAKVCIELLHAMGERVAYCISSENGPKECLNIPVLKGDENLLRLKNEGYTKLFIAIGDNKLRDCLAAFSIAQGYQLVNAISPQAIISPSAKLGLGLAIMAGAIINAESSVSDLAIINTAATIDHDCHIQRAVHIGPQCALAGNVLVGEQSFLGIGSKVIPGIEIGNCVVLGAGSVVISNIESNMIAMGVPARIK